MKRYPMPLKMRRYVFILCWLLIAAPGWSSEKAGEYFDRGRQLFESKEYKEAAFYFCYLLTDNPLDQEAKDYLKQILSHTEPGLYKTQLSRFFEMADYVDFLQDRVQELQHKNKGLEYAISAIAYIKKSFIFCIIGEGDERENLEKLIKKNKLQEKVFLLGFVDKANEYLKTFDIFTLTSLKEGLPYSILEAGLAELPVIASNVGGIPDIIENGVSGILTTKSRVGEITRAIEYLMDNPDKRELYGKNLKQKVEKDFSFEQMLERTTVLYI